MSDTPQLLLAHHLKALKLPTFLREYDKQARQCAAEGVDHVRYLVRLTELELIDRERRMVDQDGQVVKSLDLRLQSHAIAQQELELARCEYIDRENDRERRMVDGGGGGSGWPS